MEISKSDWKLFRACIAEWQENYMERLVKEYIDMLNGNGIKMEWTFLQNLQENLVHKNE